MVKAYHPWPGTFTYWKDQPLKIIDAHAVKDNHGKPGERTIIDGLPGISASSGALVINRLQPAGKKPMDGQVFLNGAKDWSLGQ